MANWAVVEDGKLVETTSQSSLKKASEASKNGMDKDAFLQLLVAQMQYQDPLEPMDNTEYISQLATFSQLEATQNLQDTISKGMANSLVGQYVILNVTDKLGNVNSVAGKVDYVMYENGEVFLAVNDGLYSLEDLDTVADSAYYEAFEMANAFSAMIAKLPSASMVTASDAQAVKDAQAVYDAMTPYQQGFVSKADKDKLAELMKKIEELTGNSGTGDETDKTDKTDEEDKSDGTKAPEGDKK